MYWNLSEEMNPEEETQINRNMRCIEMVEAEDINRLQTGLIETWDVLK